VSKETSPTESSGRLPYVGRRHDKPAEAVAPEGIVDTAYTLYRGDTADEGSRFQVATFDTDSGEEHNRALCEYAREMLQAGARDGHSFWCEKGHLRLKVCGAQSQSPRG
jgi:hypothetical protein